MNEAKIKAKKIIDPKCNWISDVGERRLLEILITNDEVGLSKIRAYKESLDVFIAKQDSAIEACKDQKEIDDILGSFKRPRLIL